MFSTAIKQNKGYTSVNDNTVKFSPGVSFQTKDALEGSGNAGIIFGCMWKCRVVQEEGKENKKH